MPFAVALRRFALILFVTLVGCEKASNEDFRGESSALPTCENFFYQEDAQYYYDTRKASQLAPDGSGVACPSLPHRPQTPPLGGERRVIGTADGVYDCVTSTTVAPRIVVMNAQLWLIERSDETVVTVGTLERRGLSLAVPDAVRITRHAHRTRASILANEQADGTMLGSMDPDTGAGGYAFSCQRNEDVAPKSAIDALPDWARRERINGETSKGR